MARKPWTNDTIERIDDEYYTTGPPSREVIPPGAQGERFACWGTSTYHHFVDGQCEYCGELERKQDMNEKFTEADLLRLAGQLDLAREQGWVPRWYFPCGDNSHKHGWRIGAWLCKHLWRI